MNDKIQKYIEANKTIEELHTKLLNILYETGMSDIAQFIIEVEFKDGKVKFGYEEWASNETYREYTTIPIQWLEDGFDYVADNKRIIEEAKERKRLAKEEARRKKAEANRKRKEKKLEEERKEYERLKAKFEGE